MAGYQISSTHFEVCGCPGGSPGGVATVTATYPARALDPNAVSKCPALYDERHIVSLRRRRAQSFHRLASRQRMLHRHRLRKRNQPAPRCRNQSGRPLAGHRSQHLLLRCRRSGSHCRRLRHQFHCATGLGPATPPVSSCVTTDRATGNDIASACSCTGRIASGAATGHRTRWTNTESSTSTDVSHSDSADRIAARRNSGCTRIEPCSHSCSHSCRWCSSGGERSGADQPFSLHRGGDSPGQVRLSWQAVSGASFYGLFGPGVTAGGEKVLWVRRRSRRLTFPQGTRSGPWQLLRSRPRSRQRYRVYEGHADGEADARQPVGVLRCADGARSGHADVATCERGVVLRCVRAGACRWSKGVGRADAPCDRRSRGQPRVVCGSFYEPGTISTAAARLRRPR